MSGTLLDDGRLERIKDLHSEGFNSANISELTGMNSWTVRRARKSMGLPPNSKYTAMSRQKKVKTIRKTLRRITGERMNWRTMAHELNAMKLGWPDWRLGEALLLYVLEREGKSKTPELLKKVRQEKAKRNWRPHEMKDSMFSVYMGRLKGEGFVLRTYGVGRDYLGPRSYELTEKAIERARMVRERQATVF